MLKHIVEAYSEISFEDALAKAMDKAAALLEGVQSDAHVAIRDLSHNPELGYHAELEITLIPLSLRENMNLTGLYKECARAHERGFRLMLKAEHDHLQHVLDEHFALARRDVVARSLPDFIIAGLGEADFNDHLPEKLERQAEPFPQPGGAVEPDDLHPNAPEPE